MVPGNGNGGNGGIRPIGYAAPIVEDNTGEFNKPSGVFKWLFDHPSLCSLTITVVCAVIGGVATIAVWAMFFHDAAAHAPIVKRVVALEKQTAGMCGHMRWSGAVVRAIARQRGLPEGEIKPPDPCPTPDPVQ
jgi:hypothetical protein